MQKDIDKNEVYVVRGDDHPSLYTNEATVNGFNFIGSEFELIGASLNIKARYRQKDQACKIINIEDGNMLVHFDEPQRAVTLGQSACFYLEDRCLGQGTIVSIGKTLDQM